MHQRPQLVWSNPRPLPHFAVTARMLTHLAEAIAQRVREGQLPAAHRLMSLYVLSPIAAGFVATQLVRAGVPQDIVLGII